MAHPVPDPMHVHGVSSYYNSDGHLAGQWVIARSDPLQREIAFREAVQAACEDLERIPPTDPPAATAESLCNLYVITDYHLGQLSWHGETGEDWDTSIAEKLLIDWFGTAIRASPDARVGVLAQLGDFLHWDGLEAVTPTSGHLLDADTRFARLVRVCIRTLRRVIDMLLQKHEYVHVLMAEGNHDQASSVWLREVFWALYEDEPRIMVDRSAEVFYVFEHGQTSLFFHHGHKRKPKDIGEVFAAKYREVFGRTKHSYAHLGHMHHIETKESGLMVIEQHRTLAARDAYSSRLGHTAGRDARVITYHSQFGEVGRITISPDMVRS